MRCGACGGDNLADSRWCAQCGIALSARCPVCAAEAGSGARFCSICGHALTAPAAGGDGAAERKQVTILFGDFSGYTAFSERLDPEELHDTMAAIWANLDAIVVAHGGRPEKHAGDGMMAVFGGRRAREEDPAEAVRAALAMQGWVNGRPPENGRPALQLRIGINTGLVVVGPVNSAGEFLAAGDAVNLASRLEQSAPPGGILIAGETHRLVFGLFDVQTMPLLQVKGKSEPVESYLILRAKERRLAGQLRGINGLETPMVGRVPELQRLEADLRRVVEAGVPQFTMVVGEAGIGKSRLLVEFRKKADLVPQYLRHFWGRSTPEMTLMPFALIRDLLFARFDLHESDPAAVAREKFERGLAGFSGETREAGGGSRAEWQADTHFLGQLLGLDFSASPHLCDVLEDQAHIRQRAFGGFSRLLGAMSRCPATEEEPAYAGVLLVLEDFHWCDDGSLELVEHRLRNFREAPLMVVISARPEFFERHPGWGRELPNLARVHLEALSDSESNALVDAILHQAGDIPAELRDLVTEGPEGNPFFIEEMIKMLMDQKVIVAQAGEWRIELGRLAGTRIPPTLTGVLQARLDGLARVERWVLQCGSVAGRVFWDGALEQMAGGPGAQVAERQPAVFSREEIANALADLCRKELVFRRAASAFGGAAEYAFKHDLLRAVAYENLLKKSRRLYHGRFADWLKEHCGDRLREFASLIATHFEHALRLAEAAEWHGRAGQQARLSYSPAPAIVHFQKALQLLPAAQAGDTAWQQGQLGWQEGLADMYAAQARFAEALEAAEAARRLAGQLADRVAEASALNDQAYLHERRADYRASVACAEQAEALALAADAPGRAERIRALYIKGWAFYRLGDVSRLLDLAGELLELCTAQADRRGMAGALKLLGVAHLQLGHFGEADRFFEQGLALFAELGDRLNAAAMWSNRGETARACGDYQSAVALYEQALAIVRQIGHPASELIYLNNLSGARLGFRQFEQAEADLRQVISQTFAPNSCVLAESWAFLSEACLGQGKLAEAMETAEKAIRLAQESESPLYFGEAWRALGRAASAAGAARLPGAAGTDPGHCFAESLRVFRQINAAGEAARTLRAWAEHELQHANRGPGRQKLREARETFLHLGAVAEAAATETALHACGGQDERPAGG